MRKNRSFTNFLHNEEYNFELLKKIPDGAEVATVLVGRRQFKTFRRTHCPGVE